MQQGDAGVAVMTFECPIADGPGYDFAVFENGFAPNPSEPNIMFLELAFVEAALSEAQSGAAPSARECCWVIRSLQ